MIDLDDQLASYSDYLDDTERSVVVLRPARLDGAPNRARRNVALIAASVIAIAGVTAVAAVARDRGPAGVATMDDGEWTVVPDPDGTFVPPPGGAQSGTGTSRSSSSNAIRVASVESLDDGFVAVGSETQGFAPFGAVWTSSDGETWERLPHDELFGIAGFSEDPDADGPTMVDVAERDGRVIIAGSARTTSDAAVWWTDDLSTWQLVDLGTRGAEQPTAIAAGRTGFAMVGIDYGDMEHADNAVGWFSTDGESWKPATFEDAWGARVIDVMAFGDGFLASGSSGSMAAVWTSDDGLDWQLADVEPTPRTGLNFTSIHSVVEFDGVLFGYGSARSSREVVMDEDHVLVQPAAWSSTDGLVWTASSPVEYVAGTVRFAGPIVATDDELIAFGEEFTGAGGFRQFELRSDDGIIWTESDPDLPGRRTAVATRGDTVVAVGDADDLSMQTEEQSEPVASASSVWILHTD